MRVPRRKLLPAALAGLVLGASAAAGAVRADERAPRVEAPAPPVAASLVAIRKDPPAWLGKRVSFVLQFHERSETWNPYLTRFGPVDWSAFSAWADERFTWDAAVFANPLTRLFVRRGSEAERVVEGARPYERYQVVGVVREIFLDDPWIEVDELKPLYERVGEGTILHVGQAREFERKGQFELALQQLERAKAAPLPQHALDELERETRACIQAREASASRRRKE